MNIGGKQMNKSKFVVSIASCFLASALIVSHPALFQAADVNREYQEFIQQKISTDLWKAINTDSENKKVNVALWLKGVDDNELESTFSERLHSAISSGEIDKNIITENDKIFSSFDKTPDNFREQLQIYESIKRDTNKKLFTEYNASVVKELTEAYDILPEILFLSSYTPLAIINSSKSDILTIAQSNEVEKIYYFDNACIKEENFLDNTEFLPETKSENSSSYGTWQSTSHITVLRDALGYTGHGIRIGLIQNYVPNFDYVGIDPQQSARLHEMFSYAESHGKIHNLTSSTPTNDSSHANYMLSILSGFTNTYTGIAPLADIYCAEKSTTLEYFEGFEDLVNADVNVICASIGFGSRSSTYDCYSKYLDSLISNTDITVCISSGNRSSAVSSYAVHNGAMAFNVLSIGNIRDNATTTYNDDVIANGSEYSTSSTSAYKPDLCAPGSNAGTYSSPGITTGGNGGTSASAAIATGICALLMEAYPVLMTDPMLMKSVLLSSSINLPNMIDIYSTPTSTEPALLRNYGSGMIDAYEAYNTLSNGNYRCNYGSYNMSFQYSVNVTQKAVNSNKDLFLCLNWNQRVTALGTDFFLETNYYVLNDFQHSLELYDPNNNLVATSDFQFDKKQYIRYNPTVAGTYTIRIDRTYINPPAYYPNFALAYSIK